MEALDKAIKKIEKSGVKLRFVHEAGPCGYVGLVSRRPIRKRKKRRFIGLATAIRKTGPAL